MYFSRPIADCAGKVGSTFCSLHCMPPVRSRLVRRMPATPPRQLSYAVQATLPAVPVSVESRQANQSSSARKMPTATSGFVALAQGFEEC